MKVSEITNEQIKEYCGLSEDCGNLELYKASAKAFIVGYTGLTEQELDEYEDLAIAYCVLINDMSYNRDYAVNRSEVNPCVRSTLSMHTKNNIR